ncbi:MAG: hypothetical protein ABSA53_00475 [Streptosporangiaceae bacterium]
MQALDSLGLGGRLVLAGRSGGPLTVEKSAYFRYSRKQVLGHWGYQESHVNQLMRFIEAGRLDFTHSISGTFSLAQAAAAVEQLESKRGNPIRLVLIT